MRDATRRNQRKKTTKPRHNQHNIPWARTESRPFWSVLSKNTVRITRTLHDMERTLYVEPVTPGYFHMCTPEDIMHVLSKLPEEDTRHVRTLILRHPTHKQRIHSSCWGRMCYWNYIDKQRCYGPEIYIESQAPHTEMRWKKHPDLEEEVERLRRDGHTVTNTRRRWLISTNPAACRATQLLHTLAHELGHWLEYKNLILTNHEEDSEQCRGPLFGSLDAQRDWFYDRPTEEREVYAINYAERHRPGLERRLPQDSIKDPERWLREDLDPAWFYA